jgi:hypothetical protein
MTQSNVVKLATSQERVVRACGTCKYRYRGHGDYRCSAVEMYCTVARVRECNYGNLWEPAPPRKTLIERLSGWLGRTTQ